MHEYMQVLVCCICSLSTDSLGQREIFETLIQMHGILYYCYIENKMTADFYIS